ncbi:MAG: phosphatidylglycerophosphatase A [Rhodocyclaceae bacterium]|jgi:phosphatidylglycerophosphatase A|nr:phosphatidylglycerophosphatase A [Rhodocyclaceae bacterium]
MAKQPPPPLKFLFADPAHFIACGCGSGLSPFAPGTAGTAFAWAAYPLLRLIFPDDAACLIALALLFVLGIVACDTTGRNLGVTDHGAIVWDEIVPFWAVLVFLPPALIASPHGLLPSWPGIAWQTAAFFLFRFFDIVKPQPARWFDTRVKNGFGVMMDDAVAAAYTALTLAALAQLVARL